MTWLPEKNVPKGVAVYGRKVGELRRQRFFSQEKLARAAGMSRENLRRIEGEDVTGIHSDNFVALAEAFGMKPDELVAAVGATRPNGTSPASPTVAIEVDRAVIEELRQLATAERSTLPQFVSKILANYLATRRRQPSEFLEPNPLVVRSEDAERVRAAERAAHDRARRAAGEAGGKGLGSSAPQPPNEPRKRKGSA